MRIKQLALASLFGAVMALPAFAQTTIAPARPVAPLAVAPGTIAPKPATVAPATAPSTAKTMTMVNVNTATPAELDALPGIGKARTAAIIKNRPYKAVDEIDTKKVIPHAVFEKIKAALTI